MRKLENGKIYDTETAKCIATNNYSSGSEKLDCGRSSSLYRTKRGKFFILYYTAWEGEHSSIDTVTDAEAMEIYGEMHNKTIEIEDAFPDMKFEEG